MKVQVGHQCQFMPRDGILTKSFQPFEMCLFFWLCIGHYSPPGGCDKLLEANNSLPMKVQVGHQCQFMPRDGILTKSSQPCEIWLVFLASEALYRPLQAL